MGGKTARPIAASLAAFSIHFIFGIELIRWHCQSKSTLGGQDVYVALLD